MSMFTPEQQAEIDKQIAAAKLQAAAEYTAKAQWFRTWLRKHDQVWVAQHVAGTIVILEAAIAFAVWYFTR